MVSLNSLSSGSMNWSPRNFRAFSSWGFSCDHICLSFGFGILSHFSQSSGHRWSGLDVSCLLVSLSPRTTKILLEVSSKKSNLSETCPRNRQISWPIDVPIIIDATLLLDIQIRMRSSGDVNGNDSSLGEWSLTLGSTWWRYMKFPDMDQKSFIASPASGNESWGGGKRPFLILQENLGDSLLELVDDVPRWMFSSPDLLQEVWFVHLRLENECSFFFGKYHLFKIKSFRVDFRCVHRFQLLKVCNQYVSFLNSPRFQCVSEEQSK